MRTREEINKQMEKSHYSGFSIDPLKSPETFNRLLLEAMFDIRDLLAGYKQN